MSETLQNFHGARAHAGPAAGAIRSIAIVGGGTAGWLAASVLARALPGTVITVVESPDIGTVGVGEATIPPIIELLQFLRIDEADFIRHTQATYKLGIRFSDWLRPGSSYWHPFGTFGVSVNGRPAYHLWHKAVAAGLGPRYNDFSLCASLGDAGRFRQADPHAVGPVAGLRHALHFDATLVARYLRGYAERLGVARLERTVAGATRAAGGLVEALQFADGSLLPADFFVDCSGFRGVLIEQLLGTGYVDWGALLPCDRAVAVQTAAGPDLPPYTHSRARAAGWQWRIPLQHRFGNGYVFSSAHCSDQQASDELLAAVGGPALGEPRLLRFTTGRRRRYWQHNCVALGLASGFLEPLESTSIHMVVSALYNLLDHFPDRHFDAANIDSYNEEMIAEAEGIRDFIVLHYCLTQRDDSPLWRDCRAMAVPDSLRQRIELYRRTGRIRRRGAELFTDLSWFHVFEGMGARPEGHDPLLDLISDAKLRALLDQQAADCAAATRAAPLHSSCFGAPARAQGATPGRAHPA